jgi:hypothetical protein
VNLNYSQISFFTVNTGRHQKLSFAAAFSYKQNNQQFICQRLKRVNNAGEMIWKILPNFPFVTPNFLNLMPLEHPGRMQYALTGKINGFAPLPKWDCCKMFKYSLQIEKFFPDTVLRLARSAKIIFLHDRSFRPPHAKI